MCCRIAPLHSKSATRAESAIRTDQVSVTLNSARPERADLRGGGTPHSIQSAGRRLLTGSVAYATTNCAHNAANFHSITPFTRYLSPGDYATISVWLRSLPRRWRRLVSWGSTRQCDVFTSTTRVSRQSSDGKCATYSVLGAVLTIAITALAFVVGLHVLGQIAPHFPVPFFPYIAGDRARPQPIRWWTTDWGCTRASSGRWRFP
jgi:hypothetical protein